MKHLLVKHVIIRAIRLHYFPQFACKSTVHLYIEDGNLSLYKNCTSGQVIASKYTFCKKFCNQTILGLKENA